MGQARPTTSEKLTRSPSITAPRSRSFVLRRRQLDKLEHEEVERARSMRARRAVMPSEGQRHRKSRRCVTSLTAAASQRSSSWLIAKDPPAARSAARAKNEQNWGLNCHGLAEAPELGSFCT